MEYFPAALEKLVEQFARLPGIGSKTANHGVVVGNLLGFPRGRLRDRLSRGSGRALGRTGRGLGRELARSGSAGRVVGA